jgi:tRNA1Val (adenine37-N6)-methyltransferase
MTGIIREPRRPVGWVPPGPPPAGARGRAELEPQSDEDLCLLSGDWRIFQKLRGHRWSLDDLVTAWVAAEAAPIIDPAIGPLRALDLGCGLGSVLMMTAWRFPAASVLGIEAQAERAAMARRSLAYNGADDRCRVFDGDLRDLRPLREPELAAPELAGPFDLITGTPPYFPRGAGTESTTPQVAPCRFELRGGVEAYLAAAAPLLAPHGRLVVCTAALERDRVIAAAAASGLDALAHWDIVPREGKAVLVMVDVLARRATASSSTTTPQPPAMHTLLVRDRANVWTADFRAVRAAMGMPATTPAGE